MAQDYKKMLDKVYIKLPSEEFQHEKLEVPNPICSVFDSMLIFHRLD